MATVISRQKQQDSSTRADFLDEATARACHAAFTREDGMSFNTPAICSREALYGGLPILMSITAVRADEGMKRGGKMTSIVHVVPPLLFCKSQDRAFRSLHSVACVMSLRCKSACNDSGVMRLDASFVERHCCHVGLDAQCNQGGTPDTVVISSWLVTSNFLQLQSYIGRLYRFPYLPKAPFILSLDVLSGESIIFRAGSG